MSLLLAVPLTTMLAVTLSAFIAEAVDWWSVEREVAFLFACVALVNLWLLLLVIGVA